MPRAPAAVQAAGRNTSETPLGLDDIGAKPRSPMERAIDVEPVVTANIIPALLGILAPLHAVVWLLSRGI